jgi:hypothetical protein
MVISIVVNSRHRVVACDFVEHRRHGISGNGLLVFFVRRSESLAKILSLLIQPLEVVIIRKNLVLRPAEP